MSWNVELNKGVKFEIKHRAFSFADGDFSERQCEDGGKVVLPGMRQGHEPHEGIQGLGFD